METWSFFLVRYVYFSKLQAGFSLVQRPSTGYAVIKNCISGWFLMVHLGEIVPASLIVAIGQLFFLLLFPKSLSLPEVWKVWTKQPIWAMCWHYSLKPSAMFDKNLSILPFKWWPSNKNRQHCWCWILSKGLYPSGYIADDKICWCAIWFYS